MAKEYTVRSTQGEVEEDSTPHYLQELICISNVIILLDILDFQTAKPEQLTLDRI